MELETSNDASITFPEDIVRIYIEFASNEDRILIGECDISPEGTYTVCV